MLHYSFTVYDFALALWITVGLMGLGIWGFVYYTRYLVFKSKFHNIGSADIYQIDHLPLDKFVELIIKLFERQGYLVRRVDKKQPDQQGTDFILQKGMTRIAVVVRHTQPGYRVGSKLALQAANGRDVYHCTNGMVISNGFFTPKAYKAAEEFEVKLMQREDLFGLLSAVRLQKHHSGAGDHHPVKGGHEGMHAA